MTISYAVKVVRVLQISPFCEYVMRTVKQPYNFFAYYIFYPCLWERPPCMR